MAAHQVKMNFPGTEITKHDVEFEVFTKGALFGKVKISKEQIEWFSATVDQPYKVSWKVFDMMFQSLWGRKKATEGDNNG